VTASSWDEVRASAPVRTADAGGWTDTWFAREGLVCNVAIDERAEVRVVTGDLPGGAVRLSVALTDEQYDVDPQHLAGRHPMLEAAVQRWWPPTPALIEVGGGLEAGSGLGSSAAVMVSLVAALRASRGESVDAAEVAAAAHHCEVASGRQSGVQDHVAAACGGISLIEIEYPRFRRTELAVAPAVVAELARRLRTVSFGHAHVSSSMHDEVIARLANESTPVALHRIAAAAAAAADALRSGDVDAYGAALQDNHEAIRSMHAGLVSADADALAELGRRHGAVGWKVNGAGGDGGSMVVLGPADPERCEAFIDDLRSTTPWRLVDRALGTDGVRVTRTTVAG
jgi:D-glycero-alpha-D-manno-heptose-7-phosphate kinase